MFFFWVNHFKMTNLSARGNGRRQWDNGEALRVWGREDNGSEGGQGLSWLSRARFYAIWGGGGCGWWSFERWIIYIVWNSHCSCALAGEVQAGPSMWVTVNETFRAEFRTGFALTHRPSLHKAQSLLVKSPILLPVARPGCKSSGPSLLKNSFTSVGCFCLPVNICRAVRQCVIHICDGDAADKLKWIIFGK